MNIQIIIIFLLFIVGLYFANFFDFLFLTNENNIFAFIYDENKQKFMVHGLWLNTTTYCKINENYIKPNDPTNFLKYNWYDRNYNNENKLFKYEYIKHGTCFNLNSTQYLNLVKNLYEKYYLKYITNAKTNKKEILLHLDSNFNYVKSTYK